MKRLALLIPFALLAFPAFAQMDFLQDKEYRHCIQLTRLDPEKAFEKALAWEDLGGGLAARHCGAVALFVLEHFEQAGERLEALAKDMPDTAPPGIVADILGHSGVAWYQAGNLDRAYKVQTAALKLSPMHPVFLTDRALTLVEAGKMREAIDDLTVALQVNRDDPEMLVYRGAAYRQVEEFDLALADLNRALQFDRTHPEGLLERGNVNRLLGRNDEARKDWLAVIEYHEGRPAAFLYSAAP